MKSEMKAVTLLSIPGTGTNFVKELVEAHPKITHSVQWSALRKSKTFLHEEIEKDAWSTGLDPTGTTLIHGHFHHLCLDFIQSLMAFTPTVVPLRDPLLALITRYQQGDRLGMLNQFVNMWVWLAKNRLEPFYFPVEEVPLVVDRYSRLSALFWYSELEWVNLLQTSWAPVNTLGNYPLKDAYKAGDFARIRKAIGQPVHYLQDAENVLRPFLELHGYRELTWWT